MIVESRHGTIVHKNQEFKSPVFGVGLKLFEMV